MEDIYPYNIFYRNNDGEELHFDKAPYSIISTDLFDSVCTLNAVGRPLSEGCRVISRYRECAHKTLKINVFGQTQEEHNAALNRLADVIGRDLERLECGRIYINGQYLLCYISQNEKQLSNDWSRCTAVTLTVVPEFPYWCTERKYSYYVRENNDASASEGYNAGYPKKYPYRYSGDESLTLNNLHYAPCPMIITIYGPAVNPTLNIGGILCGIDIELGANEYAVINQMTREIYKCSSDGNRENIFGCRNRAGNVFEFAPPGSSQMSFSGNFGIDIIIAEQRSEPLWN